MAGTVSAGAIAAAALAYGAYGRSSQMFGPSVYRGAGRRRSIALTFDDGPSPGTLSLLDYLAEQDVKATFFQCGTNVRRHKEIARRVVSFGHEIANHTDTHMRLCPRLGWKMQIRSSDEIYREFASAQETIQSICGVIPQFLRAPYGLRWFGLAEAQRRLNLLGVMWTVIGQDWKWPAESIANLVLRKASPGGVICLHDGRDIQSNPDIGETLAAVKKIVPELKARGYRFETVGELLLPD